MSSPEINTFFIDNITFMKSKPDKYYDLGFVDPPYGIKESAHKNLSRTKLAKTKLYRKEFWDIDIPPQEYFTELFRITKHQIIFGINYFVSKRELNIGPGRIIWDKVNDNTNFSDCEIAYSSFHHSTRIFRFMWNGMLQGKSIEEGHLMRGNKSKNQKRIHATEKPIELYKWGITKYAQKGWKILDTHGGSMSIALACYDLGFDIDICENDPYTYHDATSRLYEYIKEQEQIKALGWAKDSINKQYPTLF